MGRARLTAGRAGRTLLGVGTAAAVAATAHTALNLRRLRRPPRDALVGERVSALVPVRDEAARVGACLTALLRSHGVPDLEVLVLDDGSRDGTADVVRAVAGSDDRVRLLDGGDSVPPGWLGKTWACARLAEQATGSVLVFVDADVVVAPDGVAATVALLRTSGLDLVSPYPRQLAVSAAERLVQPLLQWSYLTTVPLALAERSRRPSLAVANGQLLAVDSRAYHAAGGHGAVRDRVLDDVELLRAIWRTGGRGAVADGTDVASCRMYAGWGELRSGYAKSLWTAFGSPAGGIAVAALLVAAYAVPAVAMLRGSRLGAVGYAAGVVGRFMVARRVGARAWPDPLAHPVSVAVFAVLVAESVRQHRAGALSWKGRHIG